MYDSESEEENSHVEHLLNIALKETTVEKNNDAFSGSKERNVLKKMPKINSLQLDSDEDISSNQFSSNILSRNIAVARSASMSDDEEDQDDFFLDLVKSEQDNGAKKDALNDFIGKEEDTLNKYCIGSTTNIDKINTSKLNLKKGSFDDKNYHVSVTDSHANDFNLEQSKSIDEASDDFLLDLVNNEENGNKTNNKIYCKDETESLETEDNLQKNTSKSLLYQSKKTTVHSLVKDELIEDSEDFLLHLVHSENSSNANNDIIMDFVNLDESKIKEKTIDAFVDDGSIKRNRIDFYLDKDIAHKEDNQDILVDKENNTNNIDANIFECETKNVTIEFKESSEKVCKDAINTDSDTDKVLLKSVSKDSIEIEDDILKVFVDNEFNKSINIDSLESNINRVIIGINLEEDSTNQINNGQKVEETFNSLGEDFLMNLVQSENTLDSEDKDFLFDLVHNQNNKSFKDSIEEINDNQINEEILLKLVDEDIETNENNEKHQDTNKDDLLMDFVSQENEPAILNSDVKMTFIINKKEENILHTFSDLSKINNAPEKNSSFERNIKKCYEICAEKNTDKKIPTDAFDMQEFSCMLTFQNQSEQTVINDTFANSKIIVDFILEDILYSVVREDKNNNSIEEEIESVFIKQEEDSLEQKNKSCDEEIITDMKLIVDDDPNSILYSDSSSSINETDNDIDYDQCEPEVKYLRTLPTIVEDEDESKSESNKRVRTYLAMSEDLTVVEKYALKSETSESMASIEGKSPEINDKIDKHDFDYKDESIPFESFDVFGEKETFSHDIQEVDEIREGCKLSLTLKSTGFDRNISSYVFIFINCLLVILSIFILDFIVILARTTFHLYLYYLHNFTDTRLPDSPGSQIDIPKLELEENLSSDSDPSCANIAREYSKIETIREESEEYNFETIKTSQTNVEISHEKKTILNNLVKQVITTEIIEQNVQNCNVNSVKSSRFSVNPVLEQTNTFSSSIAAVSDDTDSSGDDSSYDEDEENTNRKYKINNTLMDYMKPVVAVSKISFQLENHEDTRQIVIKEEKDENTSKEQLKV